VAAGPDDRLVRASPERRVAPLFAALPRRTFTPPLHGLEREAGQGHRRQRHVHTITNVTKAGSSYTAASNHDPDDDSDGTTIAVLRPL
jgi:hypothetical protein